MNKGSNKSNSRAVVMVHGTAVVAGKTDSWQQIVATFISSQDVKESSRKLYTRTLTQFFLWVGETKRSLVTMKREDILQYKDYLFEESLSNLTISSYLTVVRKFYEWAESEHLCLNIAKGIKTPRRVQSFKKQHLTEDKSHELLEHFKSISLRDYAIVNLILRTGLRTIEVVRANIEDITFKGDKRVLLVWGKGHTEKDDFVVLTDKAYEPIRAYLETRKAYRSKEPLFVSNSHQNNGKRLTTRTISGICKDGLVAVGLDGKEFTAHSLRHTTATTLLKHGAQLSDVQGVLRHTNPATTEIYLESIKEEVRLDRAPEQLIDDAF